MESIRNYLSENNRKTGVILTVIQELKRENMAVCGYLMNELLEVIELK